MGEIELLTPGMKRLHASTQARLLSNCRVEGECWLWTGALLYNGYGQMHQSGKVYSRRAHRCSWELRNGPVPRGLQVIHSCDRRSCVNPEHLRLGTALDNSKDMVIRGRAIAKLSASDVAEIREAYLEFMKACARHHHVSLTCIKELLGGKTWRYR